MDCFYMVEKGNARLFFKRQEDRPDKKIGTYYWNEKLLDKEITKGDHFVNICNGFGIAEYVVDKVQDFHDVEDVIVRFRIKTNIKRDDIEIPDGNIYKIQLSRFIRGHENNPFKLNEDYEPQYFCPVDKMDSKDRGVVLKDKSLAEFV